MDASSNEAGRPAPFGLWTLLVGAAMVVGVGLIIDAAPRTSATYDEVEYLKLGARWWRTGEQETITRMGSPLLFWKLQQAPVLAVLDRVGLGALIDDPVGQQARLLPLIRVGGLWLWLVAFGVVAVWARRFYGPRAMAASAWWFALSPNLLAHGGLATMEMPITASWALSWFLFVEFLIRGRRWAFVGSAVVAGIAFSCKFTAIVLPPLLGLAWLVDGIAAGGLPQAWPTFRRVSLGMLAFMAMMVASDLIVTGFARIRPSPTAGPHPSVDGRWGEPMDSIVQGLIETPMPRDWVGLANQLRHQKSGGWSYLLGERRERGWWYYYFVALAVKTPLTVGLVMIGRVIWRSENVEQRRAARAILVGTAGFLALAAIGSSRNYGVRYLLPLAPAAVVWVSGLAEGPRWARILIWAGLGGQAVAVAGIHPNELAYFNVLAGGPRGGRRVLADSNLDWGQGARSLAELQGERPELRDLTLYYFGDTDPGYYGVKGIRIVVDAQDKHPTMPARLSATTQYVGVSSSLQYGPWGPAGYFNRLRGVEPVVVLEDATIAIYRTADVPGAGSEEVAAAAEPAFETVGEAGDALDQAAGVGGGKEGGPQVGDDDEVGFAPEDLDGVMGLGGEGIEVEQVEGVARVGRAADRDESDADVGFGTDRGGADVDGLFAVVPQGDVAAPAVDGWGGGRSRGLGELASESTGVGGGGFGRFVGAERVEGGFGVGLGGSERQAATGAEADRWVIVGGAAGATEVRVGHGGSPRRRAALDRAHLSRL